MIDASPRSFAHISPEVAMTYTLWGRDRLLGHTDLDLSHVLPHVRLGFVEPTEEGKSLLPDAAGVPATTAALRRARRLADGSDAELSSTEVADFNAACDRREALKLELRDETGSVVPCWFIRIYDLQDQSWADEDTESDAQEFDVALDELEDEFEADLDFNSDSDEPRTWLEDDLLDGSSWQPPDERWDTMQYHIQVYLYDPARGKPNDAVIEQEG